MKPYLPHRHAAVLAVGGPANELAAAEESRRQMAVCGTEAYRLRAEVYRDVDQVGICVQGSKNGVRSRSGSRTGPMTQARGVEESESDEWLGSSSLSGLELCRKG